MTQTDPVILLATLVPRAGRETELRDAVLSIVPDVLREDGCQSYAAHEPEDQRGTIVMYERWRDRAAFEAHGTGPSFTALSARLDDLLAAPLDLHFLHALDAQVQ